VRKSKINLWKGKQKMSPDVHFVEDVIELKRLLMRKQRTYSNQVHDPQMRSVLADGAQLEERQLVVLSQELDRLRSMGGTWQ